MGLIQGKTPYIKFVDGTIVTGVEEVNRVIGEIKIVEYIKKRPELVLEA